ncbi:hypothetical protein Sste5346_009356 [Sporothrix stenoceras]|uniref:non-specific serine/threonine protein kinase n=1 Tax=Sporothrix stenoceras TaxID=5173 RepID=A0ABR3YLQ0_9PEZI
MSGSSEGSGSEHSDASHHGNYDRILRFKNDHHPCDKMHQYYPGSYHPVDIGNFLNKGKYKVLRKLGYGPRSTVWLARDIEANKRYAIKILKARKSTGDGLEELTMYKHLEAKLSPKVISRHFTKIFDVFEVEGPNGTHKCLVYEPMGADGNLLLTFFPRLHPRA